VSSRCYFEANHPSIKKKCFSAQEQTTFFLLWDHTKKKYTPSIIIELHSFITFSFFNRRIE